MQKLPFAVVGATDVIEHGGHSIRGRQYPWGIIDIDNEDHCDFSLLKEMLVRTHLYDLREVTKDKHYENFRSEQLRKNSGNTSLSISTLQKSITSDGNLVEWCYSFCVTQLKCTLTSFFPQLFDITGRRVF
eukprot:m.40423 g.40423  ORF g.40423 m.40423 type:complete len:131 (+) comp10351_c0_seq3:161-553(+)